MKGHIMSLIDKILLRKRSIIETRNYELKKLCQIEHTWRRSVNKFIRNIDGILLIPQRAGSKYSKIKGLAIVFSCRLNETQVN